jgi:hypothetical protein
MPINNKSFVPIVKIEQRILLLRTEKVIIDADLADFYGVSSKRLNEQVKRNLKRFPKDFMFQLTLNEKLQVVANCDHLSKLKYSKTLPYAFTEHGALMAASILNSVRAVDVSIFIVRAFVKLRQAIATHKELADKIAHIEKHLSEHDEQIIELLQIIKQFTDPDQLSKRKQIGFKNV